MKFNAVQSTFLVQAEFSLLLPRVLLTFDLQSLPHTSFHVRLQFQPAHRP
jgi:hypothetical protein